ncbi:MerR family DNA-binding protein [Sinomonas terrae]|uniref:MerR family DNA-binding protein n=1 Tax=Sinomonas terrae TaxID=2908838 RepID=A0ABS9U4M1_9MICC|nr:MerR family DNA-binding protein [Sinomonas terrae]MCH6471521.1 MerR family DNA-binding protein [Sinomonas terrae]
MALGRSSGGYRLFTDEDVEVLQFIRRAKSLGLSLSEIAEVLDLQRGGAKPCGLVIGLLDGHLAQIERGGLRQPLEVSLPAEAGRCGSDPTCRSHMSRTRRRGPSSSPFRSSSITWSSEQADLEADRRS